MLGDRSRSLREDVMNDDKILDFCCPWHKLRSGVINRLGLWVLRVVTCSEHPPLYLTTAKWSNTTSHNKSYNTQMKFLIKSNIFDMKWKSASSSNRIRFPYIQNEFSPSLNISDIFSYQNTISLLTLHFHNGLTFWRLPKNFDMRADIWTIEFCTILHCQAAVSIETGHKKLWM